jgi:hypothetical protein
LDPGDVQIETSNKSCSRRARGRRLLLLSRKERKEAGKPISQALRFCLLIADSFRKGLVELNSIWNAIKT